MLDFAKGPYLVSLGRPLICSASGERTLGMTRKALAIASYMSRLREPVSTREHLADLLWSSYPREKANQSLRQALRQIRRVQDSFGTTFLSGDKLYIEFFPDRLATDISYLLSLLRQADAASFDAAQGLLGGAFLSGYESLDPVFEDWLLVERRRLQSELCEAGLAGVRKLKVRLDGEGVEAGCSFLLKLDPAYEPAHQILIEYYLDTGQHHQAKQQLKVLQLELEHDLDVTPDPSTLLLFKGKNGKGDWRNGKDSPSAELKGFEALGSLQGMGGSRAAPPGQLAQGQTSLDKSSGSLDVDPLTSVYKASYAGAFGSGVVGEFPLPRLTLNRIDPTGPRGKRDQALLEEILTGLNAYRNVELFEEDGPLSEKHPGRQNALVDGGELGHYLLRYRYDEMADTIYLQFDDRQQGHILFNEIIVADGIAETGGLKDHALDIVSRIQSVMLGRVRRRGGDSAFAKWCQIEALLWEFSSDADKAATRMLDDLTAKHPTFSQGYAGKASILLKKLLYYPSLGSNSARNEAEEALSMSERSVLLDPWQMVNQRVFGWSLLERGLQIDARRAFLQARKLNPNDPTNLMSVAEGLAFVGDVAEAKKAADLAFSRFTVIPRVFYEYLANIYFAAGEYDACLELLKRAPSEGIFSMATRVAALTCNGRQEEARLELDRLAERTSGNFGAQSGNGRQELAHWLKRVNLYQDRVTQANFSRGAQLVRDRLGLPS